MLGAGGVVLALGLAFFRASASDAAPREDEVSVARLELASDAGYTHD